MEWYLKVLKNYTAFSGRARRKEYWMFFLFNMIISYALNFLGQMLVDSLGTLAALPSAIYGLAVLIPSIAVCVRRLHDINKSGWFMLIALIPIIGGIWLLIKLASEGDKGANQYGEDPKALEA